MTKGLKSFSHELGTKGSITPVFPRAHSYSDLEVLFNNLLKKILILNCAFSFS